MLIDNLDNVTPEAMSKSFATNAIGPLLVVQVRWNLYFDVDFNSLVSVGFFDASFNIIRYSYITMTCY